jgi:hypothetical protein
MYRNSTSLQQQNAISSSWGESVRNSEQDPLREPREDARVRMARVSGEQSRCHRRSKGGRKFCAKNDEVAQSRSGSDRPLNASDCGKGIFLFPFFLFSSSHLAAAKPDLQFPSRHFCAMARHLSTPRTASDESWSGSPGELRSTLWLRSGQDQPRAAVPTFGLLSRRLLSTYAGFR